MATEATLALRAERRAADQEEIQGVRRASFGRKAAALSRTYYCKPCAAVIFANEAQDGRCCWCGNALSEGS